MRTRSISLALVLTGCADPTVSDTAFTTEAVTTEAVTTEAVTTEAVATEAVTTGTTGRSTDAGSSTGPTPTTEAAESGSGEAPTSGTEGSSSGGTGEPLDPCDRPRPGPDTTGVQPGVRLMPSGSIIVEEDGAVIENLDIEGMITVLADNVTIRNVRLRSGDYYPIRYFDEDNVGLVVEDSEIEGIGGDVTAAISFKNYTARRLNIHGSADGLKADSDVLVEDCWIHDLSNGEGEHNDGVQSTGGAGVTLRHNDISGASNAAVQTGDEGGATVDLTLECNWFFGGGWTLNIRGTGETVPMNTQIVNNRFGRDAGYGPWTLDDPAPTISGNVYDDDDEPIR